MTNSSSYKLHTVARQYCIGQYEYWLNKYGELDRANKTRPGQKYTVEALRVFPRYNVLAAILTEIERLDPEEGISFRDMKQFVLDAHGADNIFTRPPHNDIELSAMKEERTAYLNYINGIKEENIWYVPSLFYRRVLSTTETAFIWRLLQTTWGVEGTTWHPISAKPPVEQDIIAFQDTYFRKYVQHGVLNFLSSAMNIQRCWEIREDNNASFLDVSEIEFAYNGSESYWCTKDMDWLIYASHESSVTIGGALLIALIKETWPSWEDYIWKDPFFT